MDEELFVVTVPARVIGGVNIIAEGTFAEMLEEADRLDPFYDRGLVVETRDQVDRIRRAAIGR